MRLLFDQNLSYRLTALLADVYPDSVHVRDAGLQTAVDTTIWEFAKENGLMVVTKDADFHQRSFLFGHPPKVVWIRRGNCSTKQIEAILRSHANDVLRFYRDEAGAFLVLE